MPAENGVIAIFVYVSNSSCFAHLEHEILRWKLWDQNFAAFDSGNIRIKESKKKTDFTSSSRLRSKWSISCGFSHVYWRNR